MIRTESLPPSRTLAPARLVPLALLTSLSACATKAPPPLPALERSALDALTRLDDNEALLALDALASDSLHPSSAPWLFAILRDPARNVRLRTRAASALASLGYEEGQSFCLAVLGANLDEFRASDEKHALPQIDRWAFAREIALDYLEGRCRELGVAAPTYDVNYGAPQMGEAAQAFAARFADLPLPAARVAREELEARIPAPAPRGVAEDAWARARAASLEGLQSAAPAR